MVRYLTLVSSAGNIGAGKDLILRNLNFGGSMIRLLLIFLGMVIAVKLLSIIIRSIKMFSQGSVQHKKRPKGEVGEGWIVEDREDEDKKADS